MERGAIILEVDVQHGNFKILRLLPQVLIHFLVEKWIPPTRLETVEIGKKTKGILGVKCGIFCFGSKRTRGYFEVKDFLN
jgi:hypothetical protein